MPATPLRIDLRREDKRLEVAWDDDHKSSYDLHYLRGFCPCAHCQGHAKMGWTFIDTTNPTIERIEPVGAYAINVRWEDGHTTGIYSWDALRELCPCDACIASQQEQHAVRVMERHLAKQADHQSE